MSELKDPIETLDAFIEYTEKTKKYHDAGDYKMIKMELEANNRNLISMTNQLQNSTPNDDIQQWIDHYANLTLEAEEAEYFRDEVVDNLEKLIEGK